VQFARIHSAVSWASAKGDVPVVLGKAPGPEDLARSKAAENVARSVEHKAAGDRFCCALGCARVGIHRKPANCDVICCEQGLGKGHLVWKARRVFCRSSTQRERERTGAIDLH